MRRLAASLLFAVLIMPVLLPFSAIGKSAGDQQLPSCCRRGGDHHCGMAAATDQSPQHSARQEPIHCPYRAGFLLVGHNAGLYPPSSARFYAAVTKHPATHAQVAANLLISQARSHQKRGPPSVALS